ncbi:MAG: N-methylhydantoinase A, partial [Flavobacteriales bacterium]
GIPLSDQEVTYQADVRYTGQAFQLSIEFTLAELQAQGLDVLKYQFDKDHTQLFTFALEEGHEIVMVRAIATASSGELPTMPQGNAVNSLDECKLADSKIYFEGQYHPTPIYDRNKMQTDLQILGPAIICEMDSTTVILPGYHAKVDVVGNLLINPAK